jgi:hypothetical protein
MRLAPAASPPPYGPPGSAAMTSGAQPGATSLSAAATPGPAQATPVPACARPPARGKEAFLLVGVPRYTHRADLSDVHCARTARGHVATRTCWVSACAQFARGAAR